MARMTDQPQADERWATVIVDPETFEPRRATEGEREELADLDIPVEDLCISPASELAQANQRAEEAERQRDEWRERLTMAQDAAVARNVRDTGGMFAVSHPRFEQEQRRAEAARERHEAAGQLGLLDD
jgi:hypothetical protein